jgi:hypothetical protein
MASFRNSGKAWVLEDDQAIMNNPNLSNQHFSERMGRTMTAIQYRRVHLAARLHQQYPAFGIDRCLTILCGECFPYTDKLHALSLLESWKSSELNFSHLVEPMTEEPPLLVPSISEPNPVPEGASLYARQDLGMSPLHPSVPALPSLVFEPPPSTEPLVLQVVCHLHGQPLHVQLQTVMAAIKDENGNLNNLWNDPDLAPYLVLHYEGLKHYARFVGLGLIANM